MIEDKENARKHLAIERAERRRIRSERRRKAMEGLLKKLERGTFIGKIDAKGRRYAKGPAQEHPLFTNARRKMLVEFAWLNYLENKVPLPDDVIFILSGKNASKKFQEKLKLYNTKMSLNK